MRGRVLKAVTHQHSPPVLWSVAQPQPFGQPHASVATPVAPVALAASWARARPAHSSTAAAAATPARMTAFMTSAYAETTSS